MSFGVDKSESSEDKKVVKAITRVNATMYTSMITKSIKPVVL